MCILAGWGVPASVLSLCWHIVCMLVQQILDFPNPIGQMPQRFFQISEKFKLVKYNHIHTHARTYTYIHTFINFRSNWCKVLCFKELSSFAHCKGMELSQRACAVLVYFRLVFKPCKALLKHMICHWVGHKTDIWFSIRFSSSSWSGASSDRAWSQVSLSSTKSQDHWNHLSARCWSHFPPYYIPTPECISSCPSLSPSTSSSPASCPSV